MVAILESVTGVAYKTADSILSEIKATSDLRAEKVGLAIGKLHLLFQSK